jgi:hypothetical protein
MTGHGHDAENRDVADGRGESAKVADGRDRLDADTGAASLTGYR